MMKGIIGIFFDTSLSYILGIVWIVILVLCAECTRQAIFNKNNLTHLELAELRAGASVLALNAVAMRTLLVIHKLTGECHKLELDRDIMKKQASQTGQFALHLMGKEPAAPTAESKMPDGAQSIPDEGELRKR